MPVEQEYANVSHAEPDVAIHSWLQVEDEGVRVIVPEPPAAINAAEEDEGLILYVQSPGVTVKVPVKFWPVKLAPITDKLDGLNANPVRLGAIV